MKLNKYRSYLLIFKHLIMSKEVQGPEQEEVQPNAVVVSMQVMQAVLKYLDTQPRGVVNQLAVALEQSRPVHVKQEAAPAAPAQAAPPLVPPSPPRHRGGVGLPRSPPAPPAPPADRAAARAGRRCAAAGRHRDQPWPAGPPGGCGP